MMSRKVTFRKFKMLYFRNERRHGSGNLKKDLLLGHLQPLLGKGSEDLGILISEFDDVTVKTIFCFLSCHAPVGSKRRSSWGPVWGSTFCIVPAQDLLKSPFNSTHKPSLNYRKRNWTFPFSLAAFLPFR